MNYIVLDLEWNQSPRGKEGSIDHFPFEIIEIGAIKLNEHKEKLGEFHQLISPVVYRQLHYKISEVTNLDMETLKKKGISFEQAAVQFLDWCGKDYYFVTWGSMDLTELQRNMVYNGVRIPFPMPFLYYDLQKLYSLLYGDGKEKLSLDQAVEALGIPIDEKRPFHHALYDAYYTGRIMGQMRFEQVKDFLSMDYYQLPETEKEQVYLSFPGYIKFVSREFPGKEEALADKRVNEIICCQCRRILRKKIRWFPANSKLHVGVGICPEHGLVRGKIRIKKSESGGVFVIRTTKFINNEEFLSILEKRNEVKQKKKKKSKLRKEENKGAVALNELLPVK